MGRRPNPPSSLPSATHPALFRFGFDPSVPTGTPRIVAAQILPAPERNKARTNLTWVPLEGYQGPILLVANSFMASGGDGCVRVGGLLAGGRVGEWVGVVADSFLARDGKR